MDAGTVSLTGLPNQGLFRVFSYGVHFLMKYIFGGRVDISSGGLGPET